MDTLSKIKVGSTTLHEYKAYTVSGIPLVSNQRSGVAIWSDVLVHWQSQNKLVVKLQKPVIRQVLLDIDSTLPVDRVPEIEVAMQNEQEFRRLPTNVEDTLELFIEKPVSVTLKNNKIADIVAEKDEPEWILDLKVAIIEKFQVTNMKLTTTKTVVEV